MVESLITSDDALDLIREVGHTLEIGIQVMSAANLNLGIPAQSSMTWRTVRGYVVPINYRELAVVGHGSAVGGAFHAYVKGSDIDLPLDPSAIARWEGKTFQLTYTQPVTSRGKVVVHKLYLASTQRSTTNGPLRLVN